MHESLIYEVLVGAVQASHAGVPAVVWDHVNFRYCTRVELGHYNSLVNRDKLFGI